MYGSLSDVQYFSFAAACFECRNLAWSPELIVNGLHFVQAHIMQRSLPCDNSCGSYMMQVIVCHHLYAEITHLFKKNCHVGGILALCVERTDNGIDFCC